jgi:hypothetical protein
MVLSQEEKEVDLIDIDGTTDLAILKMELFVIPLSSLLEGMLLLMILRKDVLLLKSKPSF